MIKLAMVMNLLLFIGLIVLFFIFGIIYFLIHKIGYQKQISYYKNKKIIHYKTLLPAFFLSPAYNTRIKIKAMNDLRLKDWFGHIQPIQWASFKIVPPQRDPENNSEEDELKQIQEMTLRGLTADLLIEHAFKKYSTVQYEFWHNHHGHSGTKSLENELSILKNFLINQNILEEDDAETLISNLKIFFKETTKGNIGQIRDILLSKVQKYSSKTDKPELLKVVTYSHVLAGLSHAINISLDQLREQPTFWDFIYFSVISGTTTGFGDIVPVSNWARSFNWIQILLTYSYLAFMISSFRFNG